MFPPDNSNPDNFFQTNEIILQLSALRLPKKANTPFKKCAYCGFALCLHLTCLVFFMLEIVKLRDTIKYPTKFFSHIGLLFTHAVGILKAFLLVYRRGSIEKVMDLLQDVNYKYEESKVFLPGLMIFKAKRSSSNLAILIFCLYSLAGISAYASAWSSLLLHNKSQNFNDNVTCDEVLPFYFQIPYSVNTKTQCANIFAFMCIALCGFAWFIASHDGMFCALLSCLNTQLEIVGQAIVSIRSRTLKKVALSSQYSVLRDEDCPELEDALYRELKHCIKHLTLLLQARNDLEGIFTFITLAQTLSSILIISSCMLVATTVPITSPKFFSQVEYFFCILLQLWLICNFANSITYSSGQIIPCLYESDWFSSSMRYKKSMIMIMSRMQRPLYLSIGKFTPLTLVTFMAVCNGSFSYYAVFKSIQ